MESPPDGDDRPRKAPKLSAGDDALAQITRLLNAGSFDSTQLLDMLMSTGHRPSPGKSQLLPLLMPLTQIMLPQNRHQSLRVPWSPSSVVLTLNRRFLYLGLYKIMRKRINSLRLCRL
jgi:hypothetical protein